MTWKNTWNRFWDKYMKNTAGKVDNSIFSADETRRYRIVFSGNVQGVGFRYETWSIAQKLQLAGFVENLPNGKVYAEIQGPKNKILYLIDVLKSIPRVDIEDIEIDELETKNEIDFKIAN